MMNDISICSAALLMLGADEILTFSDETRESKLCSSIYELVVRTCLSDRDWSFAQNSVVLNKLAAKPLFEYKAAFQLPDDYLRLVGKQNPSMKHSIKEQYLYCNASEIKVNYVFRASEEKFPSHFTIYVVNSLCKVLAISLLEDENKATYYDKQAIETRKKAGLIDSQSNGNYSTIPLHNYSILAVRI
jgi:hypothetical protein